MEFNNKIISNPFVLKNILSLKIKPNLTFVDLNSNHVILSKLNKLLIYIHLFI